MTVLTEIEYTAALQEFELLAADETANLERLLELRDAIHAYEVACGDEPGMPTTLSSRLELEMYRLRMKQKQFAAFLGIPATRLSEILNGKRKPNLELIKRLHDKLKISGDELLTLV